MTRRSLFNAAELHNNWRAASTGQQTKGNKHVFRAQNLRLVLD